ncbi:type IV secretory system conjugative DNA transfer family protein [Halocatena pleomorpha]|uniref:DUF87 domain-containing protein n=1 Tax=Halocatena pleomorpha TaxID=1785090 RepID=A0A3P3R5R3_9EURY|nr:type IV secretion system DNA-binding domain-containing protein [Halocatena pleomorpha]RRJ28786.1 DUF87 domain-containing protein [Halocatena pleomorpha]
MDDHRPQLSQSGHQAWTKLQRGYYWVLLQGRMRLRYLAVLIGVLAVVVPTLGGALVAGSTLSTQLLRSPITVDVTVDPVMLVSGLGVLAIYWRFGRTEYQLRHRLYEDIIFVPLTDAGERHGDPPGSKRAVQLEMDRSVLVLGETGSGKTEAIRVLAHQLQADPDEAFVIFEYKKDYQTFFGGDNIIRLSSRNSTHVWNVFHEIEDDEDYGEVANAIFTGTEVNNDYFTNAAAQVFEDVLRLMQIRADGPLTNADLLTFLDGADVDLLRKGFLLEDLSAQKHLPPDVEASSNIVSILEERVKAVFRGDFAKEGTFSVREYMANPQGRVLLLDFPIQQSSSVKPIFRLLIDWSIRFGLEDERGSYYILDEFAALPKLDMLERLVNAGRAYNCYAILGVQAIPQLRDTYGRDKADSLLSGLAQEIHLRVGQGSVDYCRKRLGRERVERTVGDNDNNGLWNEPDENDIRVFEDYPIGEDTFQNFEAGRGIVHTPAGRQRGRLYLLEDIEGRLLPAERAGLRTRVRKRVLRRHRYQPAIESENDRETQPPQLEGDNGAN